MRPFLVLLVGAWTLLAGIAAPHGQDRLPQRNLADAAHWSLDRVILKSGQVHEGLIETESEREIRFLEIRRPEGRAMYGVYLSLQVQEVASIERLSTRERHEVRQRFEEFRNRGRVEAGRMEDVALQAMQLGGVRGWRYEGPWFALESTADEEITRRAIVRVEQVFAAYRQMMPPRVKPSQLPRILLFGSTSEYRAYLQAIRLPVENPAFFAAEANLVVAGSDLARFSTQLAQVRSQHDQLRQQVDSLRKALPDRLREKREQLERGRRSEADKRKTLLSLKRQYDDELTAQQRLLDSYDRKNASLFEEATSQMFATLYHEAFHAYLENYVYPQASTDVPRWLNEGLAQLFESGILEGSTLRVDAPHKKVLAALQADLKLPQPLALSTLLESDHRSFLVVHAARAEASTRHYIYSWGLAHYLAFEQPLLGTRQLDEFVDRGSARQPPIARFEKLVGRPLLEFEPQWRKYVQGLKANAGTAR